MILKLIETNDTPKPWLIYKKGCNMFTTWEDDQLPVLKRVGFNAVLPYGISNEKIKEGDWVIETLNNNLLAQYNPQSLNQRSMGLLKVNILPEQFNYQDIIDLGLKDGDEFEVDGTEICCACGNPTENHNYRHPVIKREMRSLYKDGKVSITKPTPVTYTEEEVFTLFEKHSLEYFHFLKDRFEKQKPEETLKEWFNLNKKKQ
jgi:hypothetical protein